MSDEPRWVIWRRNLETREREVYLETYATEAEAAARADELDDEKPGYLHWTAREDEWDVGALDRMRARIDADPASRAEVDRLKAQLEAELEDGGELEPGPLLWRSGMPSRFSPRASRLRTRRRNVAVPLG
jgi:hypothetical protein